MEELDKAAHMSDGATAALDTDAKAAATAQDAATPPRSPHSASSASVSSSEESDSETDKEPAPADTEAECKQLRLYNTIVWKAYIAIPCLEDTSISRRIAHDGS